MSKLDFAMQQSFIDGAQMTLAEMNEQEYYVPDCYTKEEIAYGSPIIYFRGRCFASRKQWEDWVLERADNQTRLIMPSEEEYHTIWDKNKRLKRLTKNQN